MSSIRAAGHVHSEWSYDGRWSLEALARAFKRRGCRAVLMSEHDAGFDEERWSAYRDACAAASDSSILLVPGIEYSDAENRVHVSVWGDVPFLGEGAPTGTLLERARAHGAASFLAHPTRRQVWRDFDPAWSTCLTGIEVWNRKYDGVAPSATALELLRRYPGLVPVVGLDFHGARQFFPLRVELPGAEQPTLAGVYGALREGRFGVRAVGMPVAWLERGAGLAAARLAERGRRRLARAVRAAPRRRR